MRTCRKVFNAVPPKGIVASTPLTKFIQCVLRIHVILSQVFYPILTFFHNRPKSSISLKIVKSLCRHSPLALHTSYCSLRKCTGNTSEVVQEQILYTTVQYDLLYSTSSTSTLLLVL